MKLMRIHYCLPGCSYNKFFLGDKTNKINRFRCTHPEAKRKDGSFRILNKKLIMRGHFPKFCPLEDADFNIPKIADKGYSYEKADHSN